MSAKPSALKPSASKPSAETPAAAVPAPDPVAFFAPAGGAATARIGVLLVNLGTPDGTDYWSMRRYLKEFLSDRRVIETNRLVWWFVLNAIILTVRPGPRGRDYARIWNKARDEGPLKTVTRAQAEELARRFATSTPPVEVDFAMRYGQPAVAARLSALAEAGCDRILVVPLYPQYAAATTATVADAAFDALKTLRRQPALRIAPPWHDDPVYIDAIAEDLERQLARLDFEPEVLIASFHGIPRAYHLKGDPYAGQCAETVRLLRRRLGRDETRLRLTFQSRFGRAEWLSPYTDATVRTLATEGVKRIAVFNPGFVGDCLETLEEIGIENRQIFLDAGGEKFAALPCLNDGPLGIRVLAHVTQRELAGWLSP